MTSNAQTLPARRSTSRTVRRVVLALLIFIGGVTVGAVGATLVVKHAVHTAMHSPETMVAHITARLAQFLDLTDAQADQVREILIRRHNALVDIRREIQPRLESELNVLEDEVAAILDEKQRAKWHTHAAEMRAKWLPAIPSSSKAP